MQKRDSLSLRANARLLVNEPDSGLAAALERGVEIVDGKADVMDAGPPLRHESRDRRGGIVRLEKLYQRLSGAQAHDARPIGIIESNFCQSQHVSEKGEALGEDLNRNANMGYARATRG